MTAPPPDAVVIIDPVEFRHALPAHIRPHVRNTERITHLLAEAVRRGWTRKQILHEASRDLERIVNPGGVVTSRLEHMARFDAPGRVKPNPTQPIPWCGACSDEHARWSLDPEHPDERCPTCWTNPYAARSANDDVVPDR